MVHLFECPSSISIRAVCCVCVVVCGVVRCVGWEAVGSCVVLSSTLCNHSRALVRTHNTSRSTVQNPLECARVLACAATTHELDMFTPDTCSEWPLSWGSLSEWNPGAASRSELAECLRYVFYRPLLKTSAEAVDMSSVKGGHDPSWKRTSKH